MTTALTDSAKLSTFLVLVVAIVFSTTGELFLKIGMNRLGEFALTPGHLVRAFTDLRILVGFSLFGAGAVFWLLVLSRADLSWAYPMLALGYVLLIAESRWLLGEAVTPQRWAGAAIIILGMFVMYLTPARSP